MRRFGPILRILEINLFWEKKRLLSRLTNNNVGKRNCFSISFDMANDICTVRFAYFENVSSLKKQTCMWYASKFKVTQIPLINIKIVVNIRCRIILPANGQRCPNPTIVKNHKLIKLSCHPFFRCRRREFLLFIFIDMRGSYVVCEFPQVSASLRCVWLDLYKYRTNSSRQSFHRSRRPERFFHAPCPERIK
jgi:hypothetical protein